MLRKRDILTIYSHSALRRTARTLALLVNGGRTRGSSESRNVVWLFILGLRMRDESWLGPVLLVPGEGVGTGAPSEEVGLESSGDIGKPRSLDGRVGAEVELVGLYEESNVEYPERRLGEFEREGEGGVSEIGEIRRNPMLLPPIPSSWPDGEWEVRFFRPLTPLHGV